MADIEKEILDKVLSSPTVRDDKTDALLKEILQAPDRRDLVKRIIWLVVILHLAFAIIGAILVSADKITFRDMLDLILVLGWLTGAVTVILNFYFKK